MHPALILLAGMVVVIGSVLLLRLHAFLALVLGGLCVAVLTPQDAIYTSELSAASVEIVTVTGPNEETLILAPGAKQKLLPGLNAVLRPVAGGFADPVAVTLEVAGKDPQNPKRVQARISPAGAVKPGDRVLHQTALSSAKKKAQASIGEVLAAGFGNTCLNIGILIAMAAVIGKCLLDSGAAERIVLATRRLLGEEHTPLALLGSGFVVGVPVFFDTVFYLLLPLGKAMRVKTGKHYVLYVLAIVAGATMAHSLVPPTPGPLFVAGELGVDLGMMMMGGIALGVLTISAGYLYARWADRRWDVPLRPSAELTEDALRRMADRDPASLPPLWLSVLPILLPVVLIAGGTIVAMLQLDSPVVTMLANKNIALIISAVIALATLVRQTDRAAMGPAVQDALSSGGVIILITAAGGAFGQTLRNTGISSAIADLVPDSGSALLWIPIAFGVTMFVRIAQGSATVAMITAVGIIGPVAAGGNLGFHPLYLALAIGCGSKPILWMNDSGFWVITKMSGFTEAETLKTASAMMALMGFVGLFLVTIAAWLAPLA